MIPKKLRQGDHIRIISPSNSLLPKLAPEIIERGIKRLNEIGLTVSFGKQIREVDEFKSTSVNHRLHDLHDAFLDNAFDGILALNGGTSSNQLLSHIEYSLVQSQPKIL